MAHMGAAEHGAKQLTLEQIAARQQDIDDVCHDLKRERARLDTIAEPNARARARRVAQQIEEEDEEYPCFTHASHSLITVALLMRQLPKPDTPEQRLVQNGLKSLLEQAAVQQARCPSEWRGCPEDDLCDSQSLSSTDYSSRDKERQRPVSCAENTAMPNDNFPAREVHDRIGPKRDVRRTLEARRRVEARA